MSVEPRGVEEGFDPEGEPYVEGRLERFLIRAVRVVFMAYLLPAVCVALAVTWVALITWQAVLLVESALRRCVGASGIGRDRASTGSSPGLPTRLHIVGSTFRSRNRGAQDIRRDRPSPRHNRAD